MRTNCYTLHDTKARTYSPPFYAPTHGAATRIVTDACADPNTQLGRHPADFRLYCVGYFDDQEGCFLAVDMKEHVADVISLVPFFRQQNADLFTAAGHHPDGDFADRTSANPLPNGGK